jgi:hypothetical protein
VATLLIEPIYRSEVKTMKKKVIALLFTTALFIVSISPVFAGGDQVRGDGGQGLVNHVQVQDPPPFQVQPES